MHNCRVGKSIHLREILRKHFRDTPWPLRRLRNIRFYIGFLMYEFFVNRARVVTQ